MFLINSDQKLQILKFYRISAVNYVHNLRNGLMSLVNTYFVHHMLGRSYILVYMLKFLLHLTHQKGHYTTNKK